MTDLETIRDSIRVLLRQEEKHYRCENYVRQQPEQRQEQPTRMEGHHLYCSPLNVVAECANLVTDGPLTPVYPAEEFKQFHELTSPTGAFSKVPSSKSIHDLLYSSVSATTSAASTSSDGALNRNESFHMDRIASFSSNSSTDYFHQNSFEEDERQSSLSIWRQQMFDWSFAVVQSFQLPREVVAIAFDILDRYVASECREVAMELRKGQRQSSSYFTHDIDDIGLTREDFQLFAMVSLYMAIKMTATYQKMPLNCLIDMSRGFYSVHDIESTEREILRRLNWYVNSPTIMSYCRLYAGLFPSDVLQSTPNFPLNLEASCQVLSELALADTYFLNKSNASIALAVVLMSGRSEGIPLFDMQQFMDTLEYSEHEGTSGDSCSLLSGITCASKAGGDFESIFRRLESLC